MKPCTFCKRPAEQEFSWDMDLPSLTFCDSTCATVWHIQTANEARAKAREEAKAGWKP